MRVFCPASGDREEVREALAPAISTTSFRARDL